ncbi:MAG: HAD-IA family hydrolase [Acidobacteriia bacterium]|nr:HAD-IA family hydrolase [Terriglobia bacterium]
MDLLIFDLDGTLIDSKLDLANSVNATRAQMGLGPLDLKVIATYVGSGAPVLIRKALGPDAADAAVAHGLAFFLDHYRAHALDATALFPGVDDSLRRLHSAGKRLSVLTNKPQGISRDMICRLGLGSLFFRVYGGDSFAAKKPDSTGVLQLMAESDTPKHLTMMVGDTAVDVQTARNAGVRVCGVSYGFSPESLHDPEPDLIVDRMPELADRVLRAEL